MNFDLTDEQKQIRDTFARFCDERIAPQAAALDEAHAFPRELFAQLAGMGLFGMRYPEDVGGSGMQLTEFCLALEEIAREYVEWARVQPDVMDYYEQAEREMLQMGTIRSAEGA